MARWLKAIQLGHRGAPRHQGQDVEYHVTQILGKLGIEPVGADHRRVLAVIAWLRPSE